MDGGYFPWQEPKIIKPSSPANVVSLPTNWPARDAATPVSIGGKSTEPSVFPTSTGATPTMPRFDATPARTRAGFDSAIDAEQHDVTCDPVAFWRGLLVGLLLSLIVWSAVIAAIVQ